MKTYSSRSNAKRAGVSVITKEHGFDKEYVRENADKYFTIESDEDGGFYPHYITDRVGGVSEEKEAELRAERVRKAAEEVREEAEEAHLFGKTTGIKIEKNREERNGVTRPSAGGVCAAIWNYCDKIVDQDGSPPKLGMVKHYAEAEGLSKVTATVQYYRWREFMGIVGRLK